MASGITLRETKKARAKLALFRASLELIGQKSFREVHVEEICRKAEISKVTFFKFFPQKEDVLVYYMRIWMTDRLIELEEEPRRGLEAIRYFFARAAEGAAQNPGLMLSLIAFLAESGMHPHMPELSGAEIHLLYPGEEALVTAQNPHPGDLFRRFVEEAKEDGHISRAKETDDLVAMLFTIFYGAFLTAHLYRADDIMAVYDLHLRLIRE